MKTVKQQAEVLFQSLDFADKVMLLPIMNMLAESVKENESIEITITVDNTWHLEPKYARKALKVLSDLGCRTPLGESYEDIIKSDDSQKNACVLFLQHRGDNPLNVVKLIKEALNIGLREAKDLVDSYPVKIDLSNFQTLKPEEYKNFAIKLEEKGAIVTLEQKSINLETVTNTSLNLLLIKLHRCRKYSVLLRTLHQEIKYTSFPNYLISRLYRRSEYSV